jgi:hypothetical protein
MQNLHVDSRNMRANGNTVTWDATVSGDLFRQMGIDSFDVVAEAIVKGGKNTSFIVHQTPEAISKFERAMAQGGAGQSGA